MGTARFETTACFGRHRANAMIRCRSCRHMTRMAAADLLRLFPIAIRLADAKKRLKCSHCGAKDADLAPVPTS